MSVIDRLAAMPQTVRELLSGRTAQQLSRKPAPDAFSLRENVLHLRDIDVDGYEQRVVRLLSEENPFLPDVDGARLAVERDYNAQPVAPALEAFAASRPGPSSASAARASRTSSAPRRWRASAASRCASFSSDGSSTTPGTSRRWKRSDGGLLRHAAAEEARHAPRNHRLL